MLYSGTNPESYITEYTLVYEDKPCPDKSTAVGGASRCKNPTLEDAVFGRGAVQEYLAHKKPRPLRTLQ